MVGVEVKRRGSEAGRLLREKAEQLDTALTQAPHSNIRSGIQLMLRLIWLQVTKGCIKLLQN